jgi:putative ABC transport system ATP-binding protein
MTDSAPPAILIENLRFRWRKGEAACLDVASFELACGERVFLHGPSGSGKSTLIGLLSAVLRPEAGRVQVLGQDLGPLGGAARDRFRGDHIGLIFQQFNLVPYLSVLENVLLPCRFSSKRKQRALQSADSLTQAAVVLLEHLDIDPSLHRRPAGQLSVGQQQRVAAARALMGRPELIIADEPTSSLDEGRQLAFLELLMRECAASGASLLFVSHDRRLMPRFDRSIDLMSVNRAASGTLMAGAA